MANAPVSRILVLLICAVIPGRIALAEDGKDRLLAECDKHSATVESLASGLWEKAEIALQEKASAALLMDRLKVEGFAIESGVAGLPTAFVATYGQGKPVIGILVEYDALPGVGNVAAPRREARKDGVLSGHGCGHNLFGSAAAGAAIALRHFMAREKIAGTLKVFGTPAEETLLGKVVMAQKGVFAGLDAALDWHPSLKNEVQNDGTQAMDNFEVEFVGQAAHAAMDPWNGRSALDAVEMMNFGTNLMREHVKPSARIHYVIPEGGQAPNVVPERARVWYFVRDTNREDVDRMYSWLVNIAQGAALATGTKANVRYITGVHAYRYSRPMQEAIAVNLERVGPPAFSPEDQAFGRALQKAAGKPEVGFRTTIEKLGPTVLPPEGGSTDSAEVSRITPTASFGIATAPYGVPWHSWATTASHGTPAARKAAVVAMKVLAATGYDLLTSAELRNKARKHFEEQAAGTRYVSPIQKASAKKP
jgi:aminobenzoyl-glutamate utilization protein B